MVARRRSTSPPRTFSTRWIDDVPAKAKLQRNGKKKIVAKFSRAFSKVKHWERRFRFWSATGMRGQKIMSMLQNNFARPTRILLMRRSTAYAIGAGVGALRRAKRLAASRPARSREEFCAHFIRRSTSLLT